MSDKKEPIKIAVDAMGGDVGPEVTITGAAMSIKDLSNVRFLFFGNEDSIKSVLKKYPELESISDVHHCDYAISNDEKPSVALRTGRQSSMRLAINSVREGFADCIVSAGNTGALMAMSKMILKTLPGIHRPAIASVFPTKGEDTVMLDLGANLICDEENLTQFAILGTVYSRVVKNVVNPRVALLNIGSEDMKGHEEIRAASAILSAVEFPGKYIGFIEADDIPFGKSDVVVADGFTGNIALKMAEGVAKMTGKFLKDAFNSSLMSKIGYLLSRKSILSMKDRLDPRLYNGGMFLGLNGVCVKSHGGTDELGFSNAIKVAADLVENKFNDKVAKEIEQLMSQESFITQGLSKE